MSWAAQSRSGGRAGAGDSPEPEELEDDSVEAIGQRVNKLLDDAKHAIAKQEYARAVNILTVALDYQPSVVLCRRLRCISAAASGLYSMALEDAKLIRELRPGNPEGATLSGHIYMRMQRCADAAAAYKEALDMDPGDVVVRDSFSRALLMMRSSVPGRSSEDGNGGGAARVSARGAPESPLNKLRHPRQPLLKTIGMDDVLEQVSALGGAGRPRVLATLQRVRVACCVGRAGGECHADCDRNGRGKNE
ncbi:unnamed protein product [Pedinophyceae sp. YPF-701]|nr:unnamed protein product [Pedinophyceae sp. YPF-701]